MKLLVAAPPKAHSPSTFRTHPRARSCTTSVLCAAIRIPAAATGHWLGWPRLGRSRQPGSQRSTLTKPNWRSWPPTSARRLAGVIW